MKIAVVKVGLLGHGGVRRVIESWSRILAEGGHRVHVFAEAAERNRPLPPIPGVSVSEYTRARGRWGAAFAAPAAAARAVRDAADPTPFDVVLAHECHAVLPLKRLFPETPVLLTVHSPAVDENHLNNWTYAAGVVRRATYLPTRAYWHLTERAALQAASCVHTLSDYTWRRLTARHPGPTRSTPWQRIPGTYDDARFALHGSRAAVRAQLGMRPEERIVLTVRRLIPRNGVDRILEAARVLRRSHPDVRFWIGGVGASLEVLRSRALQLGVEDVVRFLGFVPDETLPAHYQAADAFVLPTRELECFGLPVIEAMACGCPPLVMPDGGPAEICAPFPGLVAERNSGEAFVALLRRLLAGGEVPAPQTLASHATRTYSEAANRSLVLGLVESVAGRGMRAQARMGAVPGSSPA